MNFFSSPDIIYLSCASHSVLPDRVLDLFCKYGKMSRLKNENKLMGRQICLLLRLFWREDYIWVRFLSPVLYKTF